MSSAEPRSHSIVITSDYRVPDPERVWPLLQRRKKELADIGAQSVLEYMRDNLALVMRLAGTSSIKDISRDNLVPHVA